VRARITLSCANTETLDAVEAAARSVGTKALVHLELDTGMSRGGSTAELWDRLCAAADHAQRTELVRVTGLWSHLALADNPVRSSVAHPITAFERAIGVATSHGLAPEHVHLANSAGALAHPATRMSMVRAGAALYGIETVVGRSHGLEPALRLVSRVTQLREASAGSGVGYQHQFVLREPSTLALVPLGYADGVPRQLSHGGEVVIGTRRYPIRGAISMDQIVVEVDRHVGLGDEVVLLGAASRGEPDAAEWARTAGTVQHDILSGLGRRIATTHLGNRRYGAAA
jgi:alanine racemase